MRRGGPKGTHWIALITVAIAFACTRFEPPEGAQAGSATEPLTDRYAAKPPPPTKLDVGEECTDYSGNEACESDLCLRVEPGDPETGLRPRGFCSIKCDPDAANSDCPDAPKAWRCTQVWPSEQGFFCAPPKNWSAGKATRRGGKVVAGGGGSKGQGGPHP